VIYDQLLNRTVPHSSAVCVRVQYVEGGDGREEVGVVIATMGSDLDKRVPSGAAVVRWPSGKVRQVCNGALGKLCAPSYLGLVMLYVG
jgi:hypothetical protein